MAPLEVWLRGPVAGVPAALQPVAHALLGAREDIAAVLAAAAPEVLWVRPGGAASLGFHALHVAGANDRLFTYARGETLSEAQRAALQAESAPGGDDAAALLAKLGEVTDACVAQLRATDPATLADAREVGRARVPSTVCGLLFHAAEHAQRHTGQAIATAKVLAALGPSLAGAAP